MHPRGGEHGWDSGVGTGSEVDCGMGLQCIACERLLAQEIRMACGCVDVMYIVTYRSHVCAGLGQAGSENHRPPAPSWAPRAHVAARAVPRLFVLTAVEEPAPGLSCGVPRERRCPWPVGGL